MVRSSSRPRLLCVLTPMGYDHVRRALQESFRLAPTFSMPDALAVMKAGEMDAMLCGYHFEDLMMVDVVREAKKLCAEVPIACAVILNAHFAPGQFESIIASVKAAGAADLLDYQAWRRDHGLAAADQRFCNELLRLL